jgi:DNA polymerase-1
VPTIIHTEELDQSAKHSSSHSEWIYNGLDCCVTLDIFNKIHPYLDDITSKTYDLSRALQGPILEMTLRGLHVDKERKLEVLLEFEEKKARLESVLTRLSEDGVGFQAKAGSHQNLKTFFYDVLGLNPIRKRNAKGQMAPTVNRDALERLRQYMIAEPFCNHILAIRDLTKKIGFLRTGIDKDGKMRCNFNIAGTNTGRMASSMSDFGSGTNLQNVDKTLRSVFVAPKGYKFCNIDLEQADARNVGAILWNTFHDEFGESFAGAYLDACESGDLHTQVCRMAWTNLNWGDDPSHFRSIADQKAYREMSYRDLAKRLGHGTNYYGTPRTMALHTKVAVPIIESFQARYFRAFKAIPEWHKWVESELRRTAQLTTPFGRRRSFFGRIPDQDTLRKAIAYSPQSMTADEINLGMLKLWQLPHIQLLVQVHDSILFQYPEELEDEIIPRAEKALTIEIPLLHDRTFSVPVESKVGWNWGDWDPSTPFENPDGLRKWSDSNRPQKRERQWWLGN